MVTTSFLACAAPRLVAPAMNDRMYADAATQANLGALRERGVTVIEPEEGALASRGEHGVGRLPDPAGCSMRSRRRPPGRAAPGTGCASWSRPAAPASRSTRCASSATARAGGWAWPSPSGGPPRGRGDAGRRQRRAARPRRRQPGRRRDRRRAADDGARTVRLGHVLLMAAAPADFRPAAPIAGKIDREDGARARPRADRGHPRRARLPPRARARPWSASLPRRGRHSVAPARSWRARGPTRSSSTTSPTRDRLRDLRERGHDRRATEEIRSRGWKDEVADAILDRIEASAAARAPSNPQTRRFRRARGPAILASSFSVPICIAQSRSGPGPLFLRPEARRL